MRSTDAGRRSRRHVLRSITAGAGVLAGASTFAAATEDGGDEPDPEDGWAW
ncbi:hypothetical protein [Halovivax gelatinilyticus]|uniref:hypothetical protein n=1 Tax=Halovivax gelatinilyticus TaxID=2961597 RepID=UPI0020CA8665|nr:hypothetical protein [Halovivax gelatinilyticus]